MNPEIKEFWEVNGVFITESTDPKDKTTIYIRNLPNGKFQMVAANGKVVNSFSFYISGKGSFKKNVLYYFFEDTVKTEEEMLKIVKFKAFI